MSRPTVPLRALAVAVLGIAVAGCGNSSSTQLPSGTSAAAAAICNQIGGPSGLGGGESTSDGACAQGYDDARAGRSLQDSCDSLGTGAVTSFENIADCETGFDEAGAEGAARAPAFNRTAVYACLHAATATGIGVGPSTSNGACAQGYVYAKAGRSEQASCESIGYGDVTSHENVADCRLGWSIG